MEYTAILTEVRGRVGLVRLNRPQLRNALDSVLMDEVVQALEAFDTSSEVGAMVITGDVRAFASGADVKEMVEQTAIGMLTSGRISQWDRIRRVTKPLIAAVSGWCLGGGNELAMVCDMIVASETARFGQPEINLGVIPGAGGTQRIVRAAGKAIAMEMVLNNRTLTANEALQYGLVNKVVPEEAYLEEALKLAGEIAARAPLAVRLAKQAINHAFESFLTDGLADERRAFYLLFASHDQKEGMRAFLGKRAPEWKGE
ncbi:MAG: enoyl-CoA hydratase [Chloroflexi bacterium RBG_19FT_COMBO_62_14]|nr:MAG: enoyl-CoA hydratase [Chloroflexi bacterium RBG_19FT_COMBO_62_14]